MGIAIRKGGLVCVGEQETHPAQKIYFSYLPTGAAAAEAAAWASN